MFFIFYLIFGGGWLLRAAASLLPLSLSVLSRSTSSNAPGTPNGVKDSHRFYDLKHTSESTKWWFLILAMHSGIFFWVLLTRRLFVPPLQRTFDSANGRPKWNALFRFSSGFSNVPMMVWSRIWDLVEPNFPLYQWSLLAAADHLDIRSTLFIFSMPVCVNMLQGRMELGVISQSQ